MKKFSYRILAENITLARKPRPFAGKFPTRIAFIVQRKDGTIEAQYLGKPNRLQLARLLRCGGRKGRSVHAVEFDTNGPILSVGSQPARHHFSALWELYHPWDGAQFPKDWRMLWFSAPHWLKKIGGFRVYSPRSPLRREDIQSYRARLMDVGVLRAETGLPKTGPQ